MPPLETMVVPVPLVPEKGVPQVCKDIPPQSIPLNWSNVKRSRRTYFKAIATAKNRHGSDLLSSATPHSLWTSRRFEFGRLPQRFPALLGASGPADVAETLLYHYFPPNPHLSRSSN